MTGTEYEHWAAGEAYEQFMGRWSSLVAARFVDWLNLERGQRWLDVGCGTGALTRAIVTQAKPSFVAGLDPSLNFAQYAYQQIPRAKFFVSDGNALSLPHASFDAIVSGIALNFIPQPEKALADMRRVIRSGGVVAAYVWDYAGKMEFLRYFWDAAVALDENATEHHEGNRFPLCRPEPLRQLWEEAGLKTIIVEALDIPTPFNSFDHYWQPFTVGNFPAPNYATSLDEVHRNQLRDYLRVSLPTEHDGSIHLTARVWAIRGYR